MEKNRVSSKPPSIWELAFLHRRCVCSTRAVATKDSALGYEMAIDLGVKRSDMRRWLDEEGVQVLRKIGVKRGQAVLVFGCGRGNYTIPAARVVGEEGRVYALDKDESALDKLMQRGESEGLSNIRRIDTSGEVEIRLENESVDVVLLYDIFWYFPLADKRLTKLLAEVRRVLKHQGLISVYPKHIDTERLKDKIERSGFHLKDEYLGVLVHDNKRERGRVLNFLERKEHTR